MKHVLLTSLINQTATLRDPINRTATILGFFTSLLKYYSTKLELNKVNALSHINVSGRV